MLRVAPLALVLGILSCLAIPSSALALGDRLSIYELTQYGGIWDHGDEFYLNTLLGDLGPVWAGLSRQADGTFKGDVVQNHMSDHEKRHPAVAVLLYEAGKTKLYRLTLTELKREYLLQKD